MSKQVEAFVVDDSALMRRMITDILQHSDIDVVGYARSGSDALKKIPRLKPDVVTMDVEMPELNGLQTLEKLMSQNPLPVIMLSAVTTAGAEATLKALELGALDFVAKPQKLKDMKILADELPRKVRTAAGVPLDKLISRKTKPAPKPEALATATPSANKIKLIAIGASTGGPSALQTLLSALPGDFPAAILVVQHMPKGFTKPLADRLNLHSAITVVEGSSGEALMPGKAIVIPAGWQPRLVNKGGNVILELVSQATVKTLFSPAVDVLLMEAVGVYGKKCLGVVLTGMGNDGVRGLKALKQKGGFAIAEAESSCIVYGMPRAAVEAGVIDKQAPIFQMSSLIMDYL